MGGYDEVSPATDDVGSIWYYYPQACRFLKLPHHTHSLVLPKEYSIIETTIQYIKNIDRKESFDDYFPCQNDNCTLEYVKSWFNFFVDVHNNDMVIFAK